MANRKPSAKSTRTRAGKQLLNLKVVENALRKARGNCTVAAEYLGVTRNAVYCWITRCPELKELKEELLEEELDIHENIVRDMAVNQRHPTMILAFLNAYGKHRGWGRHARDVTKTVTHEGEVTVRTIKREDLSSMTPQEKANAYRELVHGDAKVVSLDAARKRAG